MRGFARMTRNAAGKALFAGFSPLLQSEKNRELDAFPPVLRFFAEGLSGTKALAGQAGHGLFAEQQNDPRETGTVMKWGPASSGSITEGVAVGS